MDPPKAAGGHRRNVFGLCELCADKSINDADIHVENSDTSANRDRHRKINNCVSNIGLPLMMLFLARLRVLVTYPANICCSISSAQRNSKLKALS